MILENGSNFVFESVDLLSCHFHKTSLKRGKSYIKSPEWVVNKRATIILNHQNIENHPERISNIKPFINQYNWEGIDFPPGIKNWEKFERNNKTTARNILFVPHNEKEIRHAYKSKYNRKREYNRPIRSFSRLFRGITANHNGDFYCLNYLHSF